MSLRRPNGFISAGYDPLKTPNAPTIGTAESASPTSVSVTFTAPANVGGGAITSYTVVATKTSDGTTVVTTGLSSPVTITGLTTNSAYTVKVFAVNIFGSSPSSAASNSVTPLEQQLWIWGRNADGQLGLNDTANRSSPVQVGALTTWSQTAAGYKFSLAVKTDGTLWSWGYNTYSGQLGLGDTANCSSPVQVGALTAWAQVAAGNNFSLAIKTDGALWSWGRNVEGMLGLNDTANRSSPVQVGALTTWSQVAGGFTFSLAVKTDGTLWGWGYNGLGQLGLNDTANRSSPVQVGALTTWSKVTGGNNFSVAVKTDGTLWSWGANTNGRLGLNDTVYRSSPVQIGALTTWSQIAGGSGFCLAIKTDGTLWSWGYNSYGKLGLNDTANRSSPVQVGVLTTWLTLPKMQQSSAPLAIRTS